MTNQAAAVPLPSLTSTISSVVGDSTPNLIGGSFPRNSITQPGSATLSRSSAKLTILLSATSGSLSQRPSALPTPPTSSRLQRGLLTRQCIRTRPGAVALSLLPI